jgi:hypothetical protein
MNLSFSVFQAFSFNFETLPPLVDFPFIAGKNLLAVIADVGVPRRAGKLKR